MPIRAFLAVEISDEVRQAIIELREPLQKGTVFTGMQPSWSSPQSMHLTIKFLGNVEEDAVQKIAQRLAPVCAALGPFTFGVRGLGVFPSPQRPRVLWVGIKKADEELQRLHLAVEGALAPLGFAREERAFHPHLTLARFKSSRGAKALEQAMARHNRQWCGECHAEELILFQSQLHPAGAVYTPLYRFPFLAPELSASHSAD